MTRREAAQAAGITSAGASLQATPIWPQHYGAVSGTSMWPYNANVVWQDTTSNSTYCSASKALSQSHAHQARL